MSESAEVESDITSPPNKRARYEEEADRWTLSNQKIVLHPVYDSGIAKLDEMDMDLDLKQHHHQYLEDCVRLERIAELKASLSENTMQRLAAGDWDAFLPDYSNSERKTTGINFFDFLSDEVILQIFHYLNKVQLCNVALVCRRFHQLTDDESLWSRMNVSNRNLHAGAMGTLMSRQVIILKLASSNIHSPPIMPHMKAMNEDFYWRVMYLDLTMATATPACLAVILSKCRRLKKISLEAMQVNDNVLLKLAANKDLEVINLTMVTGIQLAGLKSLLTTCLNLRELNLAWTNLPKDCISYVCQSLPSTMDRLNLSGCKKLLEDDDVKSLAKNCPNLRELDLSDCTAITGETIKRLTNLNKLNFLALSRCYAVPVRSLLVLKKIRDLNYLDIHSTYFQPDDLDIVKTNLEPFLTVNKWKFSSIARPTVETRNKRASYGYIWNMGVVD